MSVSRVMFDRCAATIRAACRSPLDDRYRIGYTKNPIHVRGAARS